MRPGELTRPLPADWFDAAQPEAIGVPVLGLHGADDEISPLTEVRNWYARLPRGRLISVSAGRHDSLNDRSHRSVAASVVEFLERLREGFTPPPLLRDEADGSPAAAPEAAARLCAPQTSRVLQRQRRIMPGVSDEAAGER